MNKTQRLMLENSIYGCPTAKDAFMKLITVDPEAHRIFMEKLQWRIDNRYWLKTTVKIAIKILGEIRTMKITKEDLAIAADISIERITEIVKGRADMTLSEIARIENVLKIKLL